MQKGWSKQQFIGGTFSSRSEGLAVTFFIRVVGGDPLLAVGHKVALQILHCEQSVSDGSFPRRNLGRVVGRAWL